MNFADDDQQKDRISEVAVLGLVCSFGLVKNTSTFVSLTVSTSLTSNILFLINTS